MRSGQARLSATATRSPSNTGDSASANVEPDYRFTLANERTFLAYIRTALALEAAGLAVIQFLHPHPEDVRLALGVVLLLLGLTVAVLGYRRWEASERAIRQATSLPPLRLPFVLSIGMLGVSLTALALVIASR